MKSRIKELDVDFIGGQSPLTQEEEKQISEFLKSQKSARNDRDAHKHKLTRKNKTTA